MISGQPGLAPGEVAEHYDALDAFYRQVWGDHVHHGLWRTGRESNAEARVALTRMVAEWAHLAPGAHLCDIGCGYGATARWLAGEYGVRVTGVTISAAQHRYAAATARPGLTFRHEDWLVNALPGEAYDAAIAIESTEHMPDLARFFQQAARILRPGGRLVLTGWLAHPAATGLQRALLLRPICRESRMAQLGTFAEYARLFQESGFTLERTEDVSRQVKRTWPSCAGLFLQQLWREPRYARFLFRQHRRNRVFGLTMLRLAIAFEIGALRYGFFTGVKQ